MYWYISDDMILKYSWELIKMMCLLRFLQGQMVEVMKKDSIWNNNGFYLPVKTFLKSIKDKLKQQILKISHF